MPLRVLTEWSLQQRFALHKVVAISLAMSFGVSMLWMAEEFDESALLDRHLRQMAFTLSFALNDAEPRVPRLGEAVANRVDVMRPVGDSLIYQVWGPGGELRLRSPAAPSARPLVQSDTEGFSDVEIDGDRYRVFAAPGYGTFPGIQVAERIRDRKRHGAFILVAYLGSLLLPLILTWRLTRSLLDRAMGMLNALAARVDARSPDDSSPMPLDQSSAEMGQIVQSLNNHVRRTATVISAERQFASLAAHELRAPLAGIRAHAQLARSADAADEMCDEMEQVVKGVDHAARVLDQLLDLAHVEELACVSSAGFSPVDMKDVCSRVEQELHARIVFKRQEFVFPQVPTFISGIWFPMYLMVRNLVSNAVNYSPADGRVEVRVQQHGGHCILTVDDSGPGIDPENREKAFERYNRLQQVATEGLGLGLSIVARSVKLHHAQIALLTSPLGGLQVRVEFPADQKLPALVS